MKTRGAVELYLEKPTLSVKFFSTRHEIKPDKIKRNTLTGPISKGGLNMINFLDVEKSLNAAWVDPYRSSENSDWCAFLDSMLQE